jgi:hypothetical protein
MLTPDELADIGDRFGASPAQARRDHLISHLLGLLTEHLPDEILFFGGTALARTHLPDGRLSEDIDLIARTPGTRTRLAQQLEPLFATGLRRALGPLRWSTTLSDRPDHQPGVLATADGTNVRIQLLDPVGYPDWPTEIRDLEQRYRDAPEARLWVPTRAAFVAWKTAAWFDRHASADTASRVRDLARRLQPQLRIDGADAVPYIPAHAELLPPHRQVSARGNGPAADSPPAFSSRTGHKRRLR